MLEEVLLRGRADVWLYLQERWTKSTSLSCVKVLEPLNHFYRLLVVLGRT